MASLSFSSCIFSTSLLTPTTPTATSAAPVHRRLSVEAAKHVNKKATGHHNKTRPKKRTPSQKNRGGTREYGPLPPAPPIWGFDLEDSQGGEGEIAAEASS